MEVNKIKLSKSHQFECNYKPQEICEISDKISKLIDQTDTMEINQL